jgi:hypothetical protein
MFGHVHVYEHVHVHVIRSNVRPRGGVASLPRLPGASPLFHYIAVVIKV